MNKTPLLLGITGAFGSGKSSASKFFSEKEFTKVILSSFLEEEIKRTSDAPITRNALQDAGNALRKRYGSGVLAQKALEYIDQNKLDRVVIDGIRSMGELEVLYSKPEFISLAIVADRAVRYERLIASPRREDLTAKVFSELDYRDLGVGEKDYGLQTGLCISLADVFIENNGTIDVFEKRLEGLLKKVSE